MHRPTIAVLMWRHGSEITCGVRASDFVRDPGAVRVTSMDQWRLTPWISSQRSLVDRCVAADRCKGCGDGSAGCGRAAR